MAFELGTLAYPLRDALYLNLTNACTLSCVFCPKHRDGDFSISGIDLRLKREPSADEVWEAASTVGLVGRSEVVFTGFGESTRRFTVLVDLIGRLKSAGVSRVRLDTDGLANLREGRNVVPELAGAGLDSVSVSLNAPDPANHARVCPSRYGEKAWPSACEFIRAASVQVPETVASFVAVPGISEEECRHVAEALGARFRWRAYVAKEPVPSRIAP